MNGFITYWSKDHIRDLEKNNDTGPVLVIFGGGHLREPSIASVKKGDIIYPVTIFEGNFYAMARLPVECTEPACEYLTRETGLAADKIREYPGGDISLRELPCKFHQLPQTCCTELAASGRDGSTISRRLIPRECISLMRFGAAGKEKPLKTDKNGVPSIVSLSGFVRRMDGETFKIFEKLFQ